MNMKRIVALIVLLTAALAFGAESRPPNIIHIIGDDVGYGDLSCYGAHRLKTPNLDKLASQGMRLTSFYAPAPSCTPTRAALLTGCYPQRVGLPRVLNPDDNAGLHPDEVTIAELLKSRGYATALIGKWHLGHHPQHLPTKHGFDYYFGIPYSNDMGAERVTKQGRPRGFPPLPLIRNTDILEAPPKLAEMPDRFVEEAVKFITDNQDKPFFLFFANIETHTPWYVPKRFEGQSGDGPYGDAILCMDWMLAQVMETLDKLNLADNTLLVFTTDNGPLWNRLPELEKAYGRYATVDTSRPYLLRAGKGQARWEGGTRVPAIIRWPGKIKAGSTSDALAAGFDWYATFAATAGAKLPGDRIIDGKDLTPLLTGATTQSPHEAFYYFRGDELQAVRSGQFKLVLPGNPGPHPDRTMLYDVESDPGETKDLSAENLEVVARLQQLADQARADLGDGPANKGKNRRRASTVD